MHGAPPAQALALQRRLPSAPDPLALFAALTDGGRRRDTILLERNVGPTLLMDRAALRIETRGQSVVLQPLSAGGGELLQEIRRRFADRVAAEGDGSLRLLFPGVSGVDPEERLLAESPLDVLRCLAGLRSASREEPFTIALLGVSAFDQVDLFEDLPANREDPLGFPDSVYWLAESLVVFEPGAPARLLCAAFGGSREAYHDAASRLAALHDRCAAPPALGEPSAPAPFDGVEVDLDDEAYGAVVTALKAHIAAGDIYQVVPSRTFRTPCADPLAAFHALRRLDPSPYRFFVSAPGYQLFGASPETSVRVFLQDGWKTAEVKPIAGTRPRGATPDEDDRFEAELRLDGKELAEHMMLVDLARNDVARISLPGTRRVAKLMTVERYARVMHLVSSVTGTMRIGYDALHALQACLNVGTLTGAPKIRATELLRRFEITKRGPYGGAVGWLNGDGLMDTGVVIRSAVVKDGTAFVRVGAGVVYDSDPRREADETMRKASALLSILAGAGAGR
ncbi:MAG TPA: anthranilate synthase component 1 [Allosphingosinicella sp.]|jgi:anthranilate synthase component 1|nr:anthranilate synthase component 1 [Allosphingosinicella sp.]